MRWRLVLLAVVLLGGCHKASGYREFSNKAVSVAMLKQHRPSPPAEAAAQDESDAAAAAAAASAAPADADAASSGPAVSAQPQAPATPQLAYSYSYTLQLPSAKVHTTIAADEAACERAGLQLCQVTSANEQSIGSDSAQAALDLRAAPAWLDRFRGGLAGEAAAESGKIVQAETSTEDLSRSIVDTQATIRAQTALRDRLEQLVAERTGKLSDVLDAERELARVQGEIDAAQSELAVMQARVTMSNLHIDYTATGVAAPESALSPLEMAVDGFLGHLLEVIAFLIELVSYLLPIALIVGAIVWFVAARRRRGRKAKTPPPSMS